MGVFGVADVAPQDWSGEKSGLKRSLLLWSLPAGG